MSVDIIIPVYNAFEDLKLCVESIYKNTNLVDNRLIFINDNSTDVRIREFLEQQISERVLVFHNVVNRGFSNNINLGMEQSNVNDVILLNSDTIVTNNWVQKIVACAYSSMAIGTVTPLSNNATLCSVPIFCEENELPDYLTVEDAGKVVESCSMKKYPRITVAHGFCMFIKREVIKAVGAFDAENFGRGYGEENDFCYRAEQMGYIHVMCDDTYIYHSGTRSFVSKEKETYIREHERILQEWYPEQMHNNAVYCRDNPNGFVGENIGIYFDIYNGKPNIFYLLQSDFREDAENNIGGTQFHVKHLMQELRTKSNIFVAARNGKYLRVTSYTSVSERVFQYYIGEDSLFPTTRNREIADIIGRILKAFKIDIVHVHNTFTTSLDIFYEAEKLGIPILFTVHDYYFICPILRLVDDRKNICNKEEGNKCEKCLQKNKRITKRIAFIDMWRTRNSQALEKCQTIIAPSKSAYDKISSFFPAQKTKIKIIEHGLELAGELLLRELELVESTDLKWTISNIEKGSRWTSISGEAYLNINDFSRHKILLQIKDAKDKVFLFPTNFQGSKNGAGDERMFSAHLPNYLWENGRLIIKILLLKGSKAYVHPSQQQLIENIKYTSDDCFRVAFIGGINEDKGGRIVTNVIKHGPSDVEWYVFGGIGEESLYQLKQTNLLKTGFYYQEDIAVLIKYHKIDAICILSQLPETYSYTLSEAVICGIPVIVTDIGALGQRVKENGYGKTVPIGGKMEDRVISIIKEWKENPEIYSELKLAALNYQNMSFDKMADQYYSLYADIIAKNRVQDIEGTTSSEREWIYNGLLSGLYKNMNDQDALEKINMLEKRLNIINNSLTFKIVLKLTSMKIPFKGRIKRLLLKNKRLG